MGAGASCRRSPVVPGRPPPPLPPPYRGAAPAGPRLAPAHWLRRARSRLRSPAPPPTPSALCLPSLAVPAFVCPPAQPRAPRPRPRGPRARRPREPGRGPRRPAPGGGGHRAWGRARRGPRGGGDFRRRRGGRGAEGAPARPLWRKRRTGFTWALWCLRPPPGRLRGCAPGHPRFRPARRGPRIRIDPRVGAAPGDAAWVPRLPRLRGPRSPPAARGGPARPLGCRDRCQRGPARGLACPASRLRGPAGAAGRAWGPLSSHLRRPLTAGRAHTKAPSTLPCDPPRPGARGSGVSGAGCCGMNHPWSAWAP